MGVGGFSGAALRPRLPSVGRLKGDNTSELDNKFYKKGF